MTRKLSKTLRRLMIIPSDSTNHIQFFLVSFLRRSISHLQRCQMTAISRSSLTHDTSTISRTHVCASSPPSPPSLLFFGTAQPSPSLDPFTTIARSHSKGKPKSLGVSTAWPMVMSFGKSHQQHRTKIIFCRSCTH